MKRKKSLMKTLLAAALASAVCLPALTINASAALPPYQYGDVYYDGKVDISDVTELQRYLAGFADLLYEPTLLADFDHNGSVTIDDATWIQKYLAEMWIPEEYGGQAELYEECLAFYADYDSGKATVNHPVTFTAESFGSDSTYAFYVGDQLVQERSESKSMTYTFPEAGEYFVRVRIYQHDGFCIERYCSYRVVESYDYDTFGILACHLSYFDARRKTLEVQATGGTAPYRYSVKLYDVDFFTKCVTGLDNFCIKAFNEYVQNTGDTEWQLCYDERGAYLYHDFTGSNTFSVSEDMLGRTLGFQAEVSAADSSGNTAMTELPLSDLYDYYE